MAWVARQGVEHWDRVGPDSYREMLARGLGSHYAETSLGDKSHTGCARVPILTHVLPCIREGMQAHTHEAVLRKFVVKALRNCRVLYEVESEAPIKQGRAGQGK